MSEETKNTAQEEETTDTPVTEETVENEPEVVAVSYTHLTLPTIA